LKKEDYEKICEIGKGNYTRYVFGLLDGEWKGTNRGLWLRRFNIPYRYSPNWDINQFGEPEEKDATYKVNLG
jgi:hypothetical protein